MIITYRLEFKRTINQLVQQLDKLIQIAQAMAINPTYLIIARGWLQLIKKLEQLTDDNYQYKAYEKAIKKAPTEGDQLVSIAYLKEEIIKYQKLVSQSDLPLSDGRKTVFLQNYLANFSTNLMEQIFVLDFMIESHPLGKRTPKTVN